jgi:hypothetical protein
MATILAQPRAGRAAWLASGVDGAAPGMGRLATGVQRRPPAWNGAAAPA